MNEKNTVGKKLAILLMGSLILLVAISPLYATEEAVTIIHDNAINENAIEPIEMESDSISMETAENEAIIDNSIDCNSAIESSDLDTTQKPQLKETGLQDSSSKNYTIDDNTYSQYFYSNGNINESSIKSGDTMIIGQLTNKSMKITVPLNIIGSNDNLISNGQITIENGGSNTNITGIKIVNTDANKYGIYLKYTENVSIKNCYLKTNHFAIPVIFSNHTQIINNTIDNDLTTGHTAIPLGSSHNNNISYNTIKNGANCIYLCQYDFADYKIIDGESNNNTISFNNIYGDRSAICYGISVYGKNNTILNNTVENAGRGIVTYLEGNRIYFNNCTGNNEGLVLSPSDLTLNNTVDGELINGNQYTETIDTSDKGTFYVDCKKGNDNNNGSKESPFKTIKAAVEYINSQEQGTYTIIVAEGTYKENDIQVKTHLNLIGNGNVTIDGTGKNTIIYQEKFTKLNIKSINFINGKTKTYPNGGAIYSLSNLTLDNCTFTNNKATRGEGKGGAVYAQYANVKNCQFINNLGNEGTIYIEDHLDIKNTSFTGNRVTDQYSSIVQVYHHEFLNYGGTINISNCSFKNNKGGFMVELWGRNITGCSFVNNKGTPVAITAGNVKNCNFTNNTGSGFGGAINIYDGNVTNCIFKGNTNEGAGGAILGENSNIKNCQFYDNKAKEGGAVAIYYSGTIKNCTFKNNKADYGGAAYGDKLNVNNSTFIANKATSSGGAIYSFELKVNNSKFYNNTADMGGAIFSSKCDVKKSSFVGNDARDGKDIFIDFYINNIQYADGGVDGCQNPTYSFYQVYETGKLSLSDDNYWGDISSKDDFYDEKRIGNRTLNSYDNLGSNGIRWRTGNYNVDYLAPSAWLNSEDNGNNGGSGDGTGTGLGDGTGNGIGDGNGNGSGSGNGDGSGFGNGTGNGIGDGDGSGDGTGNEIGDGNGLGDLISDIIGSITDSNNTSDIATNITNANNDTDENILTNSTNNPKTDIETDVGTYSTDPSSSEASQSSSNGGSSGSPGDSGGGLKAYELSKEIKEIDLIPDNLNEKIILLILFSALIIIGYYKERKEDEKKN